MEDNLAQQRSIGDNLNSEKSNLLSDRDSLNEQINVLRNEKIRLAEEKAEAEGQADDFRKDLQMIHLTLNNPMMNEAPPNDDPKGLNDNVK